LRLFESQAFPELLHAAAKHHASRPESRRLTAHAIEKDYYITEALRTVQALLGDASVFKGGTSLSKGWGLVHRFSEDVDIFIDPLAFTPPLGGKAMRSQMRRLIDAIAASASLARRSKPAHAQRGIARTEYLRYESVLPGPASLRPEVCLAAGIASGREPWERRSIRSYLGEFAASEGVGLVSPDLVAFEMKLLHFRRTFVEKLFAIDHAVAAALEKGGLIGPRARHYFDLAALAVQPEVRTMLEGSEYRRIIRDCVEIDRRFYRRAARDPQAWSFRQSPALFPSARLSAALRSEYETQCDLLCFGAYPPWPEVLARLEALRQHL
jgi:hypothetical protein